LTKNHGKVQQYLGKTIDFLTPGKVIFSMFNYVQNLLDALPVDMSGEAATLASLFLLDMNNDAKKLDEKVAIMFPHNKAKLLFLCKRARPDVQTAVAFLCTQVKMPDVDDYKKLCWVMRFLHATKLMPLTLEADLTYVIKWCVSESVTVQILKA